MFPMLPRFHLDAVIENLFLLPIQGTEKTLSPIYLIKTISDLILKIKIKKI